MWRKRILNTLIVLILLLGNLAFSQEYNIEVEVKGLSGDTLLLGYHYGDKQFIHDTIVLDLNGFGVFEGEESLAGGIYLVVLPGMKYFEILIGKDQEFSIQTSADDPVRQMSISGSVENETFLEYQKKMATFQQEAGEIRNRMNQLSSDPDSLEVLSGQLREINIDVSLFWDQLISKSPESFMANIIRAMQPLDIPEFEEMDNSVNRDSMKRVMGYHYNKMNYFKNFAFQDSSMLRTPIYHNKLTQYFTRSLIQQTDSLIPPIDWVLKNPEIHPAVFQYTVIFLLNHYLQSNIMGMDAVYVHVAEDYYLKGMAPWADKTFLEKLAEDVYKIKPNLIGRVAQELVMETIDGEYRSLHQVESPYTVIYFWEPNCGHCKEETPKLFDIYEKLREKGLEVFAIYTQNKKEEWSSYLDEKGYDWINVYDPLHQTNFRHFYNVFSTPTIYLLDSEKKIIAKRLDVETLGKMLEGLIDL